MSKKKYTPEELMQLAIEESYKSIPEHDDKADPLVGAIITTYEGEILAKAHRGELRVGEHCEYTLIERKLKERNLNNCTLYVTLEPCIDEVRKPPKRGCATHITKSRIGTVYVGMRDPNPLIENHGVNYLTRMGIKVIDFPAHFEALIRKSNAVFIEEKELEQMQIKTEKLPEEKPYLEEPVLSEKITAFDTNLIKDFLSISKTAFKYPSQDFTDWGLKFEIVGKDADGTIHPTRLGLILFGKDVENIYPHTVFKVEVNYGKGEPEIKDFGGSIVTQLPRILEFVQTKALKLTINREQAARSEQADFPIDVLREAIANAIIHRDYENEKSTNFLSISPEKIIVRSPGNPENPLTLEDLKTLDTPSVSRNPKIMFVFNKMKLAEQRGIGLRNMRKLSEFGFPLPYFDLKANMLQITFGRTKEFIAEVKGIDSRNLSDEEKEGLLFIQERGAISATEYALEFNLESKTANRRLNKLVNIGLVIKVGEKRGTRYKLK